MSTLSPVVKRVDHIMIRIVEPAYNQVFAFFTQKLQLPISWPINDDAPSFKTGGVFAGNISMELFQSGSQTVLPSPTPSQAQLYGIAFEPYTAEMDVEEVERRGIEHLPLMPVPEGHPHGIKGSMWTLLFFGNMLGCDLSRYEAIMKGADDLSPFFGELFKQGMVFLCEYNPAFYDTTEGRLSLQAELEARQGGALGLVSTQEIVVGAKDFESAYDHWQRLLAPFTHDASYLWQIGDGPGLRLVPHTEDGLLSLIWKVRSLEKAAAFLREQGIMYTKNNGQVALEPASLSGLDIRLME